MRATKWRIGWCRSISNLPQVQLLQQRIHGACDFFSLVLVIFLAVWCLWSTWNLSCIVFIPISFSFWLKAEIQVGRITHLGFISLFGLVQRITSSFLFPVQSSFDRAANLLCFLLADHALLVACARVCFILVCHFYKLSNISSSSHWAIQPNSCFSDWQSAVNFQVAICELNLCATSLSCYIFI